MQLNITHHDLRLTHDWAIAGSARKSVQPVLVIELVGTDVTGLGEAAPSRRYRETVDTAAAFLARVDASRLSFADIPGSMAYLESLAPGEFSAKSAVNVALLDGAAKLSRQPLCDFLGLGFRENKHITSFSIGIDTPEVIQAKVHAAADCPVLKLKVGSPEDKANLAALRAVAPDRPLRVDANEGWKTREQALAMIEWLAQDRHIELVEQPMPAETPVRDLAWLKARSPLPLFGDEPYHTAADAAHWVEGYHGVNVKLHKTGGVTGAVAALRAAKAAGLQTMIGCMIETSILISAAAHLAELADFLDIDGNLLITNDPFRGAIAPRGCLSFAGAPGSYGLRVAAK